MRANENKLIPVSHDELPSRMIAKAQKINFRREADIEEGRAVLRDQYIVTCIDSFITTINKCGWGIASNNGMPCLYNGAFWSTIQRDDLQQLLGEIALKMGVPLTISRIYKFREDLYRQLLSVAYQSNNNSSMRTVRVNLLNGTYEITANGQRGIRSFQKEDMMTYQLPFLFDADAKAHKFQAYLNEILPDKQSQDVLAEFLGYIFLPHNSWKLEKVLMLYGSGANGKSVLFDIVRALLGGDINVTSYTMKSLTDDTGYYRWMIQSKLLNYSSELGGGMDVEMFKLLASGEPIAARLPGGAPRTISNYGKFMINGNQRPDAMLTKAVNRRLIVLPFEFTIADDKQDKQLANKIIKSELSGIFNWVLAGMDRLLLQEKFSTCMKSEKILAEWALESDDVRMFLDEAGWVRSVDQYVPFSDIYEEYQRWGNDNGVLALSKIILGRRLSSLGFVKKRNSDGNVILYAVRKTSS